MPRQRNNVPETVAAKQHKAEVLPIDPLRVLNLAQVMRRTGYGRRRIMGLIALDVMHKTPGHHFATPLRRPGLNKLEWREITVVRWPEKQEIRTS